MSFHLFENIHNIKIWHIKSSKPHINNNCNFNFAIFCIANEEEDFLDRTEKIIVAYTYDGNPVTAKDLNATGAMVALLKDAIKPKKANNNIYFDLYNCVFYCICV